MDKLSYSNNLNVFSVFVFLYELYYFYLIQVTKNIWNILKILLFKTKYTFLFVWCCDMI